MPGELNFRQELTAVFGQPVAENPTQVMVEAAYRHHKLDWRYLTIEVAPQDLAVAVDGARVMGFRGFNLTIPHKVAVIEHLDEVFESARVIGAVNCVVRRGDALVGENTDGKGFLESVRAQRDPDGAQVLIIGAGGAARAIAVELALAGASDITVVNRSAERGSELAHHVAAQTAARATDLRWTDSIAVPSGIDIVVNATSIALYPDVGSVAPLDFSTLEPGMLVNQGRVGMRYWTGVDPDPAVMRRALEEVFGST